LFYIYKLIFYQYKSRQKFSESEKILVQYLLPVYQKFSNHKQIFKKYPYLTLDSRIKVYTMKIMKSLEDAELLSKGENSNNIDRDKFYDELELEKIDLDYNAIHSEILENIIIDENDSGISDLDVSREESIKKELFQIQKMKKIIQKSVKSFLNEYEKQDNNNKPLIKDKELINNIILLKQKEKEKEEKEKENINNENKTNYNIINNGIKPCEDIKNKKIINFKKYNYLNDPNSNYNNLTNKYNIKKPLTVKRFRENHPFLKAFHTKFIKKENLDKKIIRKFIKFIKVYYSENKNFFIFQKNALFWKKDNIQKLLPPTKLVDNNNGNFIEFKSFNAQYLIWLFNQEGMCELYNIFIKKEIENIINNFIKEYNLRESKENNIIEKLREYLINIPIIYNSNLEKSTLEENLEIFDTNSFSGKIEEEPSNLTYSNNDNNLFRDKRL